MLVTQGSSARLAEHCNTTPTDAVIVGIVDAAVVHGRDLLPDADPVAPTAS